MSKTHRYAVTVEWTGNQGTGTSGQRAYARAHDIKIAGKPTIPGSSDPSFRGDPARYNPEDLLVAALSGCHMLWYLSLCASAGIVVTKYIDQAEGVMTEEADGGGQFQSVKLRPAITLRRGADPARARALHAEAHAKCFVARSVNFAVTHDPTFTEES
jgi:organic hydroperoxide reductase OsmC/OhrA